MGFYAPSQILIDPMTNSHCYRGLSALLLLLAGPFLVLSFSSSLTFAQISKEFEEKETLKQPIAIPDRGGVFDELKDLPEEIRKSKIFARDLHLLKARASGNGEYNYRSRIEAHSLAQKQQIEAARRVGKGSEKSILANAWTNIGPSGATTTGGMTASIVINPKQPRTMYAGAGGGGVWKTYNGGDNWFPLTDNAIPDLAVQSVALDPVDTNIIYVGSGNAASAIRQLNGSGVYKSTDGGATWARVGASSLDGAITKVFVHPKQSNIVFACGYDDSRGIYRSTDRGATWTRVMQLQSGRAWDIQPAGVFGNDVVLYTIVGNSTSALGGVYKSTNNGSTWSKITNGGLPSGEQIGKSAIGISTRNPNKVWILMAKASDGNWLGLYRSTDAGVSFSSVTTAPTTLFKPSQNIGAQGWYDLTIAVSPNSNTNDTVVIGGIEAWYTHNSGESWVMFSGYADLPSSAPHVDHHAFAFHPTITQRLYNGNDGGIYYSSNGGRNWTTKVNGYVTHRYYRLGLQTSDSKVTWTGAQDQGIWKHTVGANPPSAYRGLGDGFQVAVNPQSPSEVLALGPNGELYRSTQSGAAGTFVPVNAFNDGADWDAPLKIGNKSPYTRWIGRQNLWKSNDGQSWAKTAGSPGFTGQNPIRSIAIHPSNNNVVWVGGYDRIARTTNAGTDWTANTSTPSALITSIQTTGDQDWAVISLASQSTTTPRVMFTTNGGTNWTNASGSGATALPAAICWAIALDSINPRNIWYAATDFGMYYT
jgi:photosystem II stability/assembly factor-like uncharacterized protein